MLVVFRVKRYCVLHGLRERTPWSERTYLGSLVTHSVRLVPDTCQNWAYPYLERLSNCLNCWVLL